jgi:hypothetical protein
MKDARLNGRALIHIHKQMSLDYNEILKLWDSPGNRRITMEFSWNLEPGLIDKFNKMCMYFKSYKEHKLFLFVFQNIYIRFSLMLDRWLDSEWQKACPRVLQNSSETF